MDDLIKAAIQNKELIIGGLFVLGSLLYLRSQLGRAEVLAGKNFLEGKSQVIDKKAAGEILKSHADKER